MITLARHIELLLLEHDCVIVPGIGGFIANHAEACYEEGEESLFQPPYRTIGFNPQLQVNDGLLVQSYMSVYDASYPAAYMQMEKDVDNLLMSLDMTGECTLENIGTLRKSLNQGITFTPEETGIVTPSLYGLYSYSIKALQDVVKEREIEKALQAAASAAMAITPGKPGQDKAEGTSKGKDVIIKIRRRWIDLSVSAAAAVILFFGVCYPAINSNTNASDTLVASVCPVDKAPATITTVKPAAPKPDTKPEAKVEKSTDIKTEAQPEVIPETKKEVSLEATQENSAIKKSDSKPEKIANVKTEAKNDKKYAIVLASYVSEVNANILIERLAKEGYKEGRFVKNGKVSRILYSGYATESEAHKALATLRGENAEFAEAWVLEI